MMDITREWVPAQLFSRNMMNTYLQPGSKKIFVSLARFHIHGNCTESKNTDYQISIEDIFLSKYMSKGAIDMKPSHMQKYQTTDVRKVGNV